MSHQADPSPSTAELAGMPAAALAEALAAGTFTSAECVSQLLRRVADVDASGPSLRSVLALDPQASRYARTADAARRAGRAASALHGVPVLVKDSLDTAGLATTAGSLALADVPPPVRDATVVARLRNAGVLLLGKANLSEWSNFRGRGSSSGWSAVGGQTRNPHVLDRSPGGSSAGSAAAVAAGIVPAALGAETDGSILCPAALCGVVGVKPTVGLVSRAGAIPISASQDTIGPITRTVRDAALVLSIIAGPDPADPASAGAPHPVDYCAGLGPGALTGARLGVPRVGFFGYSPKTDKIIEEALALLRAAGAAVVDPVDPPEGWTLSSADELTVLCTELRAGLESYLATRPGPVPRTLAELVAFNAAHSEQELAVFGQEYFERAAAAPGLDDPGYRQALHSGRTGARAAIDTALRAHRLDALVAPTMGPAWLIDHVNGDSPGGSGYSLAAVAGYPAVTVPAGAVAGLPVGLLFLGTAFSEPRLLALAAGYAELAPPPPRPEFLARSGH